MKFLKPLSALLTLLCIIVVALRDARLAANLLFLAAVAFAGTGALYRGQLGAAPDTIDIVGALNMDVILDSALMAFKRPILPLKMFSTVFANVQLKGTDYIDVPYYPLQGIASKDFNGTYDFATGAGAKLDMRRIGGPGNWKRKYQPMAMTSAQVARLPALSAEKIGALKGEKLALDVIQDILSVVTAANFPSVAFTGAASTFDGDDVVDIRTACGKNTTGVGSVANGVTTNGSATATSATADFSFSDIGSAISGTGIPASTTIAGVTNGTTITLSANATADGTGITFTLARPTIPWPETGRGLLVNPDYDGALFKDANFRRDYTVAEGAVMVKEAQLPRIYGFEFGQSAAIPTNGENLVGMATYQSAILTAFSPIEPADGGRIVDYRIVTDPDTDISIEYRKWFSPDTDTLKEVIECNYTYSYGERLALKRMKSA